MAAKQVNDPPPSGERRSRWRPWRGNKEQARSADDEAYERSPAGEQERLIRQALVDRGVAKVPSVRTINRILGRRGALDGKQRTRRPPPPTGWYLPDVAAGGADVSNFDQQ